MNLIPRLQWRNAVKKFGVIGFLFFLIKGLIWLALIFGASNLFSDKF